MKNLRFTSILTSNLLASALVIGAFASAQSAAAQMPIPVAKATIPFAFQTGSNVMPAGAYTILSVAEGRLLFRGQHASGFVLGQGKYAPHATAMNSLIFDHVGDKYFLRQVWTAGNNEGLELPKSRAEKAIQVTQARRAPTSVVVALSTSTHR